jgi:hypothetical protein
MLLTPALNRSLTSENSFLINSNILLFIIIIIKTIYFNLNAFYKFFKIKMAHPFKDEPFRVGITFFS